MSLTYIKVAQLSYNEIKHSDWLKIVMGLGTANQSDLFVYRSFATPKFVHDVGICSPVSNLCDLES